MASLFPVAFLRIICIIIISVHLSAAAIDDPVPYNYYQCYEPSRSSSPVFQANLNSTLQYLTSNSTTTNENGFYSASSGTGVDTANGLFLCRGDGSGQQCQECLRNTTRDITFSCPNHKEAIIWSNHCMLRFSNRSIFSTLEEDPTRFLYNRNNVTDPSGFNATLWSLMNRLISEAAVSRAPRFYAADDVIATALNRLYGMVQCTPDITGPDCRRCLSDSLNFLPTCCAARQGSIILKPSCSLRFEIFPFYDTRSPLSPAPPAPETSPAPDSVSGGGKKNKTLTVVLAIVIPLAVILALILSYLLIRRRRSLIRKERALAAGGEISSSRGESVQFDFATIEAATKSFSVANKIGEGGFGPVYQGTLPDGQRIAIKRLSEGSSQGRQEFKNEVEVLAKLQHRNLVRLLGFCLHEKERILVYEYVPNKSLDHFLFDPETQLQLDWGTRMKIIQGIARGLLYLHEDSRLKIIHRDLKASNILLDENMNAKIADFGTARIFEVDQTQESTNRIIGTYGYMSPEYALEGNFSIKSDVFSFGVLVLEIISGKKNRNVSALLNYAWTQWREEMVSELVDSTLRGSCPLNEVTRCVHIALLCVEEDPTNRPTMATIVTMLNSSSFPLPFPQKPTCFAYTGSQSSMPTIASESDQSTSKSTSSVKEATITLTR